MLQLLKRNVGKSIFAIVLLLSFSGNSYAGSFADFSVQDDDTEFISLQKMCLNQGKYSPYILYSTAITNSFYFGLYAAIIQGGGLKEYIPTGTITNLISYRLTYNHVINAISPTNHVYFGTLGEYYSYTTNGIKDYRGNMGVHFGMEQNLYRKYLALFEEGGPAFQVRSMTMSNDEAIGAESWGGIGYYANFGFRISFFTTDITALSLRIGASIEGGGSVPMKVVRPKKGTTESADLNGMFFGPLIDFGYSF